MSDERTDGETRHPGHGHASDRACGALAAEPDAAPRGMGARDASPLAVRLVHWELSGVFGEARQIHRVLAPGAPPTKAGAQARKSLPERTELQDGPSSISPMCLDVAVPVLC
jgi:hypothetical protein